MSLTTGSGPLSGQPAGRFSAPVPAGVVYVEPFLRRVRGLVGGRTVIDSEGVVLVHRPGQPPNYAFPAGDVGDVPAEPEPEAPGYVRVAWDAVSAWFEEEQQIFGKLRNPYHRVDCLKTRRQLRVEVSGAVLVDTDDTIVVHETAQPPRLYVDRAHVRTDLLSPSTTTTYCGYKGTASYWNAVVDGAVVEDVAWSYEDPLPESVAIRGMLAFDPERAAVLQVLPHARPLT